MYIQHQLSIFKAVAQLVHGLLHLTSVNLSLEVIKTYEKLIKTDKKLIKTYKKLIKTY